MTSTMRAPGGRAAISPNTTSPSALRYHSMWREPVAEPERLQDGGPERAPSLKLRRVQIPQSEVYGANPLMLSC